MNQKTINKRDNQRHLSREFQSVLAERVCDTKHVIAWVNSIQSLPLTIAMPKDVV
jgi:hypothetical protein